MFFVSTCLRIFAEYKKIRVEGISMSKNCYKQH